MTKMLASVNCLSEAKSVLAAGVDIIDLKQPALGALGALPLAQVAEIVAYIAAQCPVSATVGDLPMQPEIIYTAVNAMSKTGVDYVKIGFFPSGDWLATIDRLAELTSKGLVLIAVMFADQQLQLNYLEAFKTAGFSGVMLDTQDKARGSLSTILSNAELAEFVAAAKSQQLLCGLAGSLRVEDVPRLCKLNPDYLGFRGALCEQLQRTATLNPAAIQAIKQALLA